MGFLNTLFGKKERTATISSVLPQEIYEAGVLELQDIIAPSALKITPKGLNLGDKIARTFFVISYPRYLSESWFSPVINLDKVFDISISIRPIETEKMLRQFQKKVAEEKGVGSRSDIGHRLQRFGKLEGQSSASARKAF